VCQWALVEVGPLGAKGSDGPLIQIMRAHVSSIQSLPLRRFVQYS
jgi:hypothetical protein